MPSPPCTEQMDFVALLRPQASGQGEGFQKLGYMSCMQEFNPQHSGPPQSTAGSDGGVLNSPLAPSAVSVALAQLTGEKGRGNVQLHILKWQPGSTQLTCLQG